MQQPVYSLFSHCNVAFWPIRTFRVPIVHYASTATRLSHWCCVNISGGRRSGRTGRSRARRGNASCIYFARPCMVCRKKCPHVWNICYLRTPKLCCDACTKKLITCIWLQGMCLQIELWIVWSACSWGCDVVSIGFSALDLSFINWDYRNIQVVKMRTVFSFLQTFNIFSINAVNWYDEAIHSVRRLDELPWVQWAKAMTYKWAWRCECLQVQEWA